MKKNILYIGSLLLMLVTMAACSPEDYPGINVNDVPSSFDGVKYTVTTEDYDSYTLVKFVFSSDNKDLYPIWNVQNAVGVKTTATEFEVREYVKGTYNYTLQLGNRNGVSDVIASGSYDIARTTFDFEPYVSALTRGASDKQWRIYASKAGHLGCGPVAKDDGSPSKGNEWWSAGPNEKIDNTIYDDFVIFADGGDGSFSGDYVYDPGPNGYMFINHDVTKVPGCTTGLNDDYDMATSRQESHYAMTVVNDHAAIVLDAETLFPFVTSDDQYENPVFEILNGDEFQANGKVLELKYTKPDNSIAWHFLLVNGEDEAQEEAFDINKVDWVDVTSTDNILKSWNEALPNYTSTWSNWSWADDVAGHPTVTFANGIITTVWPQEVANWEYWHGYINLLSDLTVDASNSYDFSITLEADKSIDGVLVKLESDPESGTPLFEEKDIALPAGESVKVQLGKLPAEIDYTKTQVLVALKGAGAGTTLTIKDIILQTHREKSRK